MRILHDILFPKKHQVTSSPPEISKEYSEDDIAKLIKIRDDADLKLRIARLSPMERLKLSHIVKERRHGKNRKK